MASTSKSSKSMKQLIEKFCAVTGAEKEIAKKMLEACNSNLQMAINMHVDAAEAPQAIDGRMSPALKTTASAECFDEELRDDVRAPIPPTRGILVEEPFSFGVHGRRKPPRSIFDGFRDFEAETRRQEQELLNPSDTQNRQKKQTLEDLFRPPIDLMHKGTFESAREQGQINNKWIMVNVQNVQEFSCQMLNRDVWSNPTVKTIIEKHFVFFQVYHDSEEGQRYMQFYKIIEWPYIAIIDPRTGENLIVWNKVDAVSFCDLITEFLSGHPPLDGTTPPTPPKKRQKIDSIVDASEDSQLEAAIRASLLETARLQKIDDTEDESSQEVETFESDNEASSSNSSNSRITTTKTTAATTTSCSKVNNNIHVKNNNNNNSNSNNNNNNNNNNNISEVSNENCKIIEDEKEADSEKLWTKYLGNEDDVKSKVVLRFPDGKKEQLSLPASSKVKALLLYVESLHFSNEKYELVTNFPRRQLSLMDHNLTLKEASIFPQETIFVQAR